MRPKEGFFSKKCFVRDSFEKLLLFVSFLTSVRLSLVEDIAYPLETLGVSGEKAVVLFYTCVMILQFVGCV